MQALWWGWLVCVMCFSCLLRDNIRLSVRFCMCNKELPIGHAKKKENFLLLGCLYKLRKG